MSENVLDDHVSGAAGKAAEIVCSWQSSEIGERCRLYSNARMYQTITSGVMAGSAGEAAEGVAQQAKLQIGSASRSRRRVVTSDSSIPCSQQTRQMRRGQATDTRVQVTL